MYELDKFAKEGMTQEAFENSRNFLMKYVNLLTKNKSAELGYKIDSEFYGIPEYGTYLKAALQKLTLQQVNSVIRRRLHSDKVVIVAVAKDADGLKQQLTSGEPSPMQYNSPKRAEILEEDKIVERFNLNLRPEDVTVVPVEKVFE
jgi:zinc protease